jgi:DNA processing protein
MRKSCQLQPNRWRDLMIALNAVLAGDRETVCKLAANPAAWIGLHSAAVAGAAQRLGVRVQGLRQAIALLPRVASIAGTEISGSEQVGARIITRFDPDYPGTLLDLQLPPPVLYCRGILRDNPAIAVVGSRRSDAYGLEVSRLFARELGDQGLTVVSGLALGVDAEAHRGALDAEAPTVAVLGCGIDIAYPYRNRHLAADITETGAVISEFPLGSEPRGWCFPVRNRIIAGLSCGTLVVRATPRSGSLITARHALELGRDVYAVPGNIFDQRSVGTNSLIRDGALPIQHPREILESLPLSAQARLIPAKSTRPTLDQVPAGLEDRLAALLKTLPVSRAVSEEEAISGSDLSLEETLAGLLELEMMGWIERHPGPSFLRHAKRPAKSPVR